MEEEKNHVYIVSWPKEPAHLEHQFKKGSPAEVEIRFDKNPANLVIEQWPKDPMNVDMNMHLMVRQPVPVCIRLCEPICAKSDYKISVNFLDRPIGSIVIKGMTKFFACTDNEAQQVCVKFNDLKEGMTFESGMTYEGLTFTPVSNQVSVITNYDPVGMNKLRFPPAGIRIDFPYPVDKVSLRVFRHAEQVFHLAAYAGTVLLKTADEGVHEGQNTLEIAQEDMTSVVLSGGKYAEALIEVCYISF
jgi:hypothetical protein